MQARMGCLGKRSNALYLMALALLILATAMSLVGRLEWLLAAADDAEHPHATRGTVVVLGYRLDWPEGTPVRLHTLLAKADAY